MNSWSIRRKRLILTIVLAVLVVLIGVPTYFLFYKAPTCTDGKMNGDETGVDCGGSCQKLCAPEALPIISEGDPQVLTVASSTYEVIGFFTNPNPSAEIYRAKYTIKIYDTSGVSPIKIIEGDTFVPKDSSFAIFQGPFNMDEATATRATLEWNTDTLIWRKNPKESPDVYATDIVLSSEDTAPRLEAIAHNGSFEDVQNIEFVAIISDQEGNAIAASKTYIDRLSRDETQPLLFSWPFPFTAKATSIKIIPRVYPDGSFLR